MRRSSNKCKLGGHIYEKEWLKEFMKNHTAWEVRQALPDIKTPNEVYATASRLGVKLKKTLERRQTRYVANTLCWTCTNATDGNLCPWVKDYTPVEGWKAIPHRMHYNNVIVDSFNIIKCPLYRKEERE